MPGTRSLSPVLEGRPSHMLLDLVQGLGLFLRVRESLRQKVPPNLWFYPMTLRMTTPAELSFQKVRAQVVVS